MAGHISMHAVMMEDMIEGSLFGCIDGRGAW